MISAVSRNPYSRENEKTNEMTNSRMTTPRRNLNRKVIPTVHPNVATAMAVYSMNVLPAFPSFSGTGTNIFARQTVCSRVYWAKQ